MGGNANGYRSFGGGDGNILKLYTGNDCMNSVNIQKTTELYTSNGEFYGKSVISQ